MNSSPHEIPISTPYFHVDMNRLGSPSTGLAQEAFRAQKSNFGTESTPTNQIIRGISPENETSKKFTRCVAALRR